jgi:chromosome segregation ATPase
VIDPAAEGARAKAREIRASIERIEGELTSARERLAATAEELMLASRAVRTATAELSAVGGLDER